MVTDDQFDADPPHLRVTWINWDSGFRGSKLQIGDKIIAVNGVALAKPKSLQELQKILPKQIGHYAEAQAWRERGARDNQAVVLDVISRASSGVGTVKHQVKGTLRATRRWYNPANNRGLLGDGPDRIGSDGFSSSWGSWYEDFVRRGSRVLDGGWSNRAIANRSLLEEHLEDEPRIEALIKKYPGAFATTTREDFKRVHTSLLGTRYNLTQADLEYRQVGEAYAEQIAAKGKAARKVFSKANKSRLIKAFPAADPLKGKHKKVAQKLVELPAIEARDWVMQVEGCYLTKGQPQGGWYFISCQDPAAQRMFEAMRRYQQLVTPRIDEKYSIFGRISATPSMLVIGGRGTAGLSLEPVAASIGDKMFVDLTKQDGAVSRFAGEEALGRSKSKAPPKSASPKQVMEAWASALEAGDQKAWSALYAKWTAQKWKDDGSIYYVPYYKPQLDSEWTRARRKILSDTYDIRVAYVSDTRVLVKGNEFKGAPKIESVTVEVDHVGKFGNAYRAYVDVSVHRTWTLQRRNAGAWRITGTDGI